MPRVFELRVYTAQEGKLEPLKARFLDHTNALFDKHHMEIIGFWTPHSGDPKAGHMLIYMLAHPSREAAVSSWKEFQDDPEWKRVKADSEKDGPLTVKMESTFLDPTSFSPMK